MQGLFQQKLVEQSHVRILEISPANTTAASEIMNRVVDIVQLCSSRRPITAGRSRRRISAVFTMCVSFEQATNTGFRSGWRRRIQPGIGPRGRRRRIQPGIGPRRLNTWRAYGAVTRAGPMHSLYTAPSTKPAQCTACIRRRRPRRANAWLNTAPLTAPESYIRCLFKAYTHGKYGALLLEIDK